MPTPTTRNLKTPNPSPHPRWPSHSAQCCAPAKAYYAEPPSLCAGPTTSRPHRAISSQCRPHHCTPRRAVAALRHVISAHSTRASPPSLHDASPLPRHAPPPYRPCHGMPRRHAAPTAHRPYPPWILRSLSRRATSDPPSHAISLITLNARACLRDTLAPALLRTKPSFLCKSQPALHKTDGFVRISGLFLGRANASPWCAKEPCALTWGNSWR